jgi:hypothetical protein
VNKFIKINACNAFAQRARFQIEQNPLPPIWKVAAYNVCNKDITLSKKQIDNLAGSSLNSYWNTNNL